MLLLRNLHYPGIRNVTTPYYPISALHALSVKCMLQEVKNKRKFQTSSSTIQVIAVAYKFWLLTRGSKSNDLTWKLKVTVVWKAGC